MSDMKDPLAELTEGIEKPQTYAEQREALQAEQAGMSRQEIAQKMAAESEGSFDPETAVASPHNWVDRGEVMSCEGANHPSHRHFKVKARR